MGAIIDLRGLTCPLPLLKLREKIKEVPAGEEVTVLTSDPGTMAEIPLWAEKAGIEVVNCCQENGHFKFILRKVK
jgi:tRNA 2-thiouridine synthesizing protein A